MFSFTGDGWAEYTYREDEDRKILKKIRRLMRSLERDGPMEGEGHPEKLKNLPDTYSRKIDEKNRLVYIATIGNCTIKSCKGHYEDD